MKPYAPLGLLYLSSHLRARGFDVEIYDSTFGSREELFRILETEPPRDARHLRQSDDARATCSRSSKRARACGWRVIAGRPGAGQLSRKNIWTPGADAMVAGEGELALEALLRRVRDAAIWRAFREFSIAPADGSMCGPRRRR